MKAVIDTNVLRVAARQHADVSDECVTKCIQQLSMMQKDGVVVIDDDYKILGEYLKSPPLMKSNEVGGKFLKWLLQNQCNILHVAQVSITETGPDYFSEFPDPTLQPTFDPADRKFVAVANAHPDKPPVWQAADCKWLDWWPALQATGVRVEFLCPDDVCGFYRNKFAGKPLPALPA